MTIAHAPAAIASGVLRPFAFVWRSWRAITARQIRNAAVVAALLGTVQGVGNAIFSSPFVAWWRAFLSDFFDNVILVLVLLLTLAVVTRIPASRIPKWVPILLAALMPLMVGWLIGELPAFLVRLSSGNPADWPGLTLPALLGTWMHMPPMVLLSSFLVLGYMFARDAQERADALRSVQLDGARASRRAYEARLSAMQARIEPQFLFDTLRQVGELYDTDAAVAERMLDDLIVYLRAALPSVDRPNTRLATELALAEAWLDMARIRMGGRLRARVDATVPAREARMPPMVLQPLVEAATSAVSRSLRASESVDVEATVNEGRLRVVVRDSGPTFPPRPASSAVAQVQERLLALYGERATLGKRAGEFEGAEIIVEIPYEPA